MYRVCLKIKHSVGITLSLLICFLLFASPVQAISVLADQKTIAWQAPTTNTEGQAIPSSADIRYTVFLLNTQTQEIVEVTTEPIVETQYTITFEQEGTYYFGVKAIRYWNGTSAAESQIAWSNNPAYCADGEPIDITKLIPTSPVTALHLP